MILLVKTVLPREQKEGDMMACLCLKSSGRSQMRSATNDYSRRLFQQPAWLMESFGGGRLLGSIGLLLLDKHAYLPIGEEARL